MMMIGIETCVFFVFSHFLGICFSPRFVRWEMNIIITIIVIENRVVFLRSPSNTFWGSTEIRVSFESLNSANLIIYWNTKAISCYINYSHFSPFCWLVASECCKEIVNCFASISVISYLFQLNWTLVGYYLYSLCLNLKDLTNNVHFSIRWCRRSSGISLIRRAGPHCRFSQRTTSDAR